MINDYIPLISQFGFPIFVALYFMLRMEKTLKQNTEIMIQIKEVINKCNGVKR